MIGRLLGQTQVQTTHRYAHLFDDPLRVGLNEVGEMLRPKFRLIDVAPSTMPEAEAIPEIMGVRLLSPPEPAAPTS
jgi:hypothetical protein